MSCASTMQVTGLGSSATASPAVILLRLSALDLRPLDGAVTNARLHCRSVLSAWRMPRALVSDSELVISELSSNAVRHAVADAGGVEPFPVRLRLSGLADGRLAMRGVLIEVWDASGQMPALRSPEPDALSGRGLLLVSAYATRWGCYPTPPAGKTVWASLLAQRKGS